MISVISSIALLVSGLGIMNTVFSSAAERKREIGICISIGASASDILWCFITETSIIVFTGAIIGALLGNIIIGIIVNILNISYTFELFNSISAILAAVLIGIMSSIIPAIKASKLDPINALKN